MLITWSGSTLDIIYQTSIETGADSSVKIILSQNPCEIHEISASLKNTLLFIYGLSFLASRLYHMQVRNRIEN